MIKCDKIKIFDKVEHNGTIKTVVAVSMGHIALSELSKDELFELDKINANFEYPEWTDLDEINLIEN